MVASAISGFVYEMRVQGRHWLDYDSVALAVLVIGIGIVMLLALDRSRKGDRITPVAPVIRTALPPGCDAPFSSLAKFSPPNFAGRCLT
jgi:hypothetical protein